MPTWIRAGPLPNASAVTGPPPYVPDMFGLDGLGLDGLGLDGLGMVIPCSGVSPGSRIGPRPVTTNSREAVLLLAGRFGPWSVVSNLDGDLDRELEAALCRPDSLDELGFGSVLGTSLRIATLGVTIDAVAMLRKQLRYRNK